jgi:hypothetical protein
MRIHEHRTAPRSRGHQARSADGPTGCRGSALVGFLAAALLLAACGDPQEPEDDSALREVREERDELRAELETVEAELRDAQRELERLQQQVDDHDPGEAEPEPTREEAAPQRTPEGLIDQPRSRVDPEGLPEGFEPGTTPWESYGFPEPVEQAFERPGDLALAIAEAVGGANLGGPDGAWETTVRVLMDEDDPDLAYAAVLRWGFLDDAVAGQDVRVTLTREDDGWRAGGAERRLHCLRGVTDDGLCS